MVQPMWKLFLVLSTLATYVSAQDDEPDETGGDDPLESDMLTPEQLQGLVGKLDTNQDGKVSMDEMMSFASKMRHQIAHKDAGAVIEEMDSDKDGFLSLEELMKDMEYQDADEADKLEAAASKQLEEAKFKAADEDGDGKLSPKEVPALFYPEVSPDVLEVASAASFKQKDSDGDGFLTSKEFWEMTDGTDPSDEEEQDFKRLDKNGDGKLNVEEIMAWESGVFHTEEAMRKLFDISDKNSDMHLSNEELQSAREAIAASDAHYHLLEWAEHNEL